MALWKLSVKMEKWRRKLYFGTQITTNPIATIASVNHALNLCGSLRLAWGVYKNIPLKVFLCVLALKYTETRVIFLKEVFSGSTWGRRMMECPFLISIPAPSLKQKSVRNDGNNLALPPPTSCQVSSSPVNQGLLSPALEEVCSCAPQHCISSSVPATCWSHTILPQDTHH